MADAETEFRRVSAAEGWDESTEVSVLLEYIQNQDSPEAFADFLSEKRDTEDEPSQEEEDGEDD